MPPSLRYTVVMAANDLELAYAQARYDLEGEIQEYVRREANCPWLHLTVNPISDRGPVIEVWFEQPGRERYLVCRKPFEGRLHLGSLIQHLREIDGSNEPLTERVARQEKEHDQILKQREAEYLDAVMPAAERMYFELYRDATGAKGFLH